MKDLDTRAIIARLERRGGRIRITPRVMADRLFLPGIHEWEYACDGRDDGATVIIGPRPEHRRWILRTEADRAALAHDIDERLASMSAEPDGAGVEYEVAQVDEVQADAGYGQVGCLFALVAAPVGCIVGLIAVFLLGGSPSWLLVTTAPIFGLVAAMMTGDQAGTLLTSLPPLRDRAAGAFLVYLAFVSGLVATLVVVVSSFWPE